MKQNKLIKPKALRHGDTLGVVATSTPIHVSSQETIERGYAFLRSKGFRIVEAANCRKMMGHAAGSIEERVQALHDFFKNPEINGIISYWGGHQTHQLLEYLDFDLIRNNPKPFIGFSDVTSLHAALYSQAGLISFSGPAVITFGKPTVPEYTWDHFEKVLMGHADSLTLKSSETFSDNKWYLESAKKMIFKPSPSWRVYRSGKAQGELVGGNIGTLLLLAGTKYWPDLRGKIFFAEEDESENPKTVDRIFTHLRQMKVFEQIAGMIIGRFSSDAGFSEQDSFEMILDQALKGYDFPVMTGIDFGHTDPLVTLPMGIQCRIDTEKREITYLESGVVDK